MNREYIFQNKGDFGTRIMIWYGANAIPINYRDITLDREFVDKSFYKFIPIDEHLVWTEDHKNFLKPLLDESVKLKVCGSLMFYQPKKEYKPRKIHDIMIFDVTPYNDAKISYSNTFPDSLNSIYNFIFAKRFWKIYCGLENRFI